MKEVDNLQANWSYADLWDKFPVPARPDSEEIELIEKAILNCGIRSPKVLILGSTIEYRSLAKKLGLQPVIVDFSQENYDSLTSYSKEKFNDERFVAEDWLKMKFHQEFDFVLGHRTFNVIRIDQVEPLFKKIYLALKPDGIAFCRGNVRFEKEIFDLKQIVSQWYSGKKELPLFSFLEVPLYINCADELGYLNYPKARKEIVKLFQEEVVEENEYKEIQPLISMPEGTKFVSYIDKERLVEIIEKIGYKRHEWLFTSHNFTKNMPIIKLFK